MNGPTDPPEDARREIELGMVEALLRQTLHPEPAAREARIVRLLDALEQEPSQPDVAAAPVAGKRAGSRRLRRWATFAAAACLVLAAAMWLQSTSPDRQAHATVQRSLQGSEQAVPRQYRFLSVVRRPLIGRREIEGDLYVDGARRFAVRYPSLLPGGDIWLGGNDQERWVVPAIGPVQIGDERMLQHWAAERTDLTTPYLHITTLLQRMTQDFELELLPDEAIPDLTTPGRTIDCRRVRGILRDPAGDRRPRQIDLWADRASGVACRLVLDWRLPPGQLGRSLLTLELVSQEALPPEWFEPSAHEGGRANISTEF
ncbi:hypothetical protein [Lignipirellula cremea]|uniref:Uncharacterized protein n=1 Tax=Lignipirellula cremea TaxID=2528010 RepID=A0A518E4F4_9BACT|nr:hypothetical protein [Lignipirellula cremea]QDU98977.1 hypothetical protein Pla8534_68880 [Lignipirellula cremea]